MSVLDRVDRRCRDDLDERALRTAVLADLRDVLVFDAYVWLLTDPETTVGWGPIADIPLFDDLPAVVRARYLAPTERWSDLPVGEARRRSSGSSATPLPDDPWSAVLAGAGATDVLSVVVGDRFGRWALLELWRFGGTFAERDERTLGAVARRLGPSLRERLATTFSAPAPMAPPEGPVVLLLSDDLQTVTQTVTTEAYLRRLLPTRADRAPVPAAAYNVAAQLLAIEAGVDDHAASARMYLQGASWVTARAGRLVIAGASEASIAVSIEPCPSAERVSLYARVVGLSARETEILTEVTLGHSTQQIARRLFVSEHTVQDHLKSVFEKSDTKDRRTLVARATGVTAPA